MSEANHFARAAPFDEKWAKHAFGAPSFICWSRHAAATKGVSNERSRPPIVPRASRSCSDGETASHTHVLASRHRSHKESRGAAAPSTRPPRSHAPPQLTHRFPPRVTPRTQRRTKIDWLEKVAQTFYAVSLLAFPEWWLTENFVDGAALANNDSVLALASIMGLLCLTINIITFVIRNAKNTRVELMKKMDYVAAVTWSFFLVNAVRIQQDGLFEDAAHKQNLGIFAVIIAAEAYQSTTRKPKSK